MKEECTGKMLVVGAFFLALAIILGSYMLAQVDYSPKVNISDTSMPNVYVSSTPPEHTISVSATASQQVTPDLLIISIRVETEDENAKDSQERNAEVMAEVREELEALGVPEEEIQSSSYSVDVVRESEYVCDTYCHYEYVITGYETVHILTLSLSDLESGGDIIDAVTGVGTNETFVDYIYFTLKDETREELEKELLKTAAEDAKEKAQNIATGLGVTLGRAVSASESSYYPYYSYKSYYGGLEYAAEAIPTELSAGEVEASATVNVEFELS
ncbi:SIMPL domain-containing protein [Candidatus Micrarchaeota archaeon]|nr:SIMPL domain-containing protein [Candidatus Micrarchaeota archaeon]